MKTILLCLGLLVAGLAAGMGAAWFIPAESLPVAAPLPVATDAAQSPPVYVDLHNQFVIPVVSRGTVTSMVVITLGIETGAADEELVRAAEPRLRDQFLQVLFNHANAGKFDGIFTTPAAMGELRQSLLAAAQERLGPAVRDVLIVDMIRQDG